VQDTREPVRWGRAVARAATIVAGVALVSQYFVFLVLHLRSFARDGSVVSLAFAALESLVLALFVLRRPAVRTGASLRDVVLAFGGTFAGMLYEPVQGPGTLGTAVFFTGLGLQLVALLSLNRSFGVLPALRGVQTSGLYGAVRHPLYASYVVTWIGYLLNNPSTWNGAVFVVALLLAGARTLIEEAVLRTDPAYVAYAARVRWRMVPGVF
jgi:protein-S-isoprenylcysteine O-methyltransferase Ste14